MIFLVLMTTAFPPGLLDRPDILADEGENEQEVSMSVFPTKILLPTDGSDEAADWLSKDTASGPANRTFALP